MMGIYQIKNIVNGKLYIGSSVRVKERWRKHRNRLDGGYHKNKHLENAWNKHGEKSFTFEPLVEFEDIPELALRTIENLYIYNLSPEYNIAKSATENPMWGRKVTNETSAKLSKAAKGRVLTEAHKERIGLANKGKLIGTNHPYYGRIVPASTRAKISLSNSGEKHHNSRLTALDVKIIRKRYATENITQQELADEYGVIRQNISKIVLRKSWRYI